MTAGELEGVPANMLVPFQCFMKEAKRGALTRVEAREGPVD